jgi:hypothetical protein
MNKLVYRVVVIWLFGIMMMTAISKAQHQVPKIVGYRVVENTELGCWSKLDIFWDNGTSTKEKELIKKKIIQYELYSHEGVEPIITITRKNGLIQNYHIVKLPSDTFWRQ